MAAKARVHIPARIDDELAATATRGDVLAAGAMAGFTTGFGLMRLTFQSQAGVRGGGESARVVGVAFVAGAVADKFRAFDVRRHDDGALNGRTGNEHHAAQQQSAERWPEHPGTIHLGC